MSADLHIHILCEPTSEAEVAYFHRPVHSSDDARWKAAYDHIAETPSIWIGQVSWLKALLTDDEETYIPDTVQMVQDVIGTSPILLDKVLLTWILSAFDQQNTTDYEITTKEKVEAFLRAHLGEQIFTVSW